MTFIVSLCFSSHFFLTHCPRFYLASMQEEVLKRWSALTRTGILLLLRFPFPSHYNCPRGLHSHFLTSDLINDPVGKSDANTSTFLESEDRKRGHLFKDF